MAESNNQMEDPKSNLKGPIKTNKTGPNKRPSSKLKANNIKQITRATNDHAFDLKIHYTKHYTQLFFKDGPSRPKDKLIRCPNK